MALLAPLLARDTLVGAQQRDRHLVMPMVAAMCQPCEKRFLLVLPIAAVLDSCERCVRVSASPLALDLASQLTVAAQVSLAAAAAMGLVCRCPSLAAVVARVPTALGSVCRWVSVAARVPTALGLVCRWVSVAARVLAVAAAMGSVCKWLFLLVPQPASARVL